MVVAWYQIYRIVPSGKPLMTRHCMLDINAGKENLAILGIKN